MFKFNVTFACGFDIVVKASSAAEARDVACEAMELMFGNTTPVVSVVKV
jgi:hypothetical protein